MYTSVAVVVTMTVNGTSAETIVLGQPNRSARPTAIATTAASVRTIAARARHERYTTTISAMRNTPKSGITRVDAVDVFASSHAFSQGEPTRRTAVNGPADSNGFTAASIAARALSRSAG